MEGGPPIIIREGSGATDLSELKYEIPRDETGLPQEPPPDNAADKVLDEAFPPTTEPDPLDIAFPPTDDTVGASPTPEP